MMDNNAEYWAQTSQFVAQVQAMGDEIGMPYIAAQADLADPNPLSDEQGVPYALSTFRWINPASQYYRDRKLALNQPFLNACRLSAEPFYFSGGAFHMDRPSQILSSIDCTNIDKSFLTAETIIVPVHQPRSVLGAILWCAKEPIGVGEIFRQYAAQLQYLAIQFISAHNEASGRPRKAPALQRLTRREAQCLRWAAAGKTDSEIGIILDLSISTVRFHLRNAAGKLGATGRTQTIQMATGLGFIGAV